MDNKLMPGPEKDLHQAWQELEQAFAIKQSLPDKGPVELGGLNSYRGRYRNRVRTIEASKRSSCRVFLTAGVLGKASFTKVVPSMVIVPSDETLAEKRERERRSRKWRKKRRNTWGRWSKYGQRRAAEFDPTRDLFQIKSVQGGAELLFHRPLVESESYVRSRWKTNSGPKEKSLLLEIPDQGRIDRIKKAVSGLVTACKRLDTSSKGR